jgi:hypothetical protein
VNGATAHCLFLARSSGSESELSAVRFSTCCLREDIYERTPRSRHASLRRTDHRRNRSAPYSIIKRIRSETEHPIVQHRNSSILNSVFTGVFPKFGIAGTPKPRIPADNADMRCGSPSRQTMRRVFTSTGSGEIRTGEYPPQRFSENDVDQSAGFTFSFLETIRLWKMAMTNT